MKRRFLIPPVVCLCAVACSGNVTAPTPPPIQPSAAVTGRLIATNGGQPLAGVTVSSGSSSAITDAAGQFSLSGPAGLVTLTGPSIISRTTLLAPDVEAFGPGFDLAFYRQFARNGFEHPEALQPLRHLTRAPILYLKTVDEAGTPIDAATLDIVQAAMVNVASTWTGSFGLAGVERGTSTKAGVSGYVTVTWPNPALPSGCGLSDVGLDGGVIALNANRPQCACLGSKVYPLAAKHELGHAFGYYHTGDPNDVMSILSAPCDKDPSPREREYARYVYHRPNGNTDPDRDPF